jgi:hypothetical protein
MGLKFKKILEGQMTEKEFLIDISMELHAALQSYSSAAAMCDIINRIEQRIEEMG